MRADPRRIHELEFDLGFRADPPELAISDAPGSIVAYSPGRPGLSPERLTGVVRELWTKDVLPDEVRDVQVIRAGGSLVAMAAPSRFGGRWGLAYVDRVEGLTALVGAVDEAVERAVSVCWMDSSYS